jgi:vacuolar-type H+-ATPase subunit H
MELVKKIRQAEEQAREIIEKAKADAAEQAEEERKNRRQLLTEAEQQRKKAIEDAVGVARSQGAAEAEKLKAKAEKKQQQLREKAAGRMIPAVKKVMEYLKG